MNYYHRIQNAIDYMDQQLTTELELEKVASEAFMSLSAFYRLFMALVGYSVKEYIRLRCISESGRLIKEGSMRHIDIGMMYGYSSPDAFSRAFKRITGLLPSEYKRQDNEFKFERIDIVERFEEQQDDTMREKYPEIKVLKELQPMRVAYYCYIGESPEEHAFRVINQWLDQTEGLRKSGIRVFGYNNPSPSEGETSYGYEVCVTLGDNQVVNHDLVKTKTLAGGRYAVVTIKFSDQEDMGQQIMNGWKRFNEWIKESKYTYGEHQWMEEHLDLNQDMTQMRAMDLYMPIK